MVGQKGGGICKEHQRPLKAIKNLSAASAACQLASFTSPRVAPRRQPWLYTHTHTSDSVCCNACVCVCARVRGEVG